MHWSERIIEILQSSSGNLKELAEIAGLDPGDLYRFQDLSGCDLRGQDLRGLNLEGCNIEKAIIDDSTKIDPLWDFRVAKKDEEYVYLNITRQLNTMILNYMDETGYAYAAWAQRKLLTRGLRLIHIDKYQFYKDIINANRYLKDLVYKRGSISIKILLNSTCINDIGNKIPNSSTEQALAEIILVGMISRKIRHGSKKDYSQVSVNAFYPPKLMKVEGAMEPIFDFDNLDRDF